MRKMHLALVLISALLTNVTVHAHEGDHGPAQMEAPHGGIVRTLETIHLELVPEADKFRLYLFDKNGKPADTSKIPLKASLLRPKAKASPLELTRKEQYWEASFDAKGAHRITLIFDVEQGGHKDKIEYTIETKRKS